MGSLTISPSGSGHGGARAAVLLAHLRRPLEARGPAAWRRAGRRGPRLLPLRRRALELGEHPLPRHPPFDDVTGAFRWGSEVVDLEEFRLRPRIHRKARLLKLQEQEF